MYLTNYRNNEVHMDILQQRDISLTNNQPINSKSSNCCHILNYRAQLHRDDIDSNLKSLNLMILMVWYITWAIGNKHSLYKCACICVHSFPFGGREPQTRWTKRRSMTNEDWGPKFRPQINKLLHARVKLLM